MKKLLYGFIGLFGITYLLWWCIDFGKHLLKHFEIEDYDPWNEYHSEEDPIRTSQTTTTASSGTTQPNNTERKSQ